MTRTAVWTTSWNSGTDRAENSPVPHATNRPAGPAALLPFDVFGEDGEVDPVVVKVNRPTSGLDLNVPFGGVKASSTNTFREQGSVATDFYTWTKSVYMGVE